MGSCGSDEGKHRKNKTESGEEGTSEEEVYNVLQLLGIPKEKATSLDVQSIYEEIYGIDLDKEPNLSFEENKQL